MSPERRRPWNRSITALDQAQLGPKVTIAPWAVGPFACKPDTGSTRALPLGLPILKPLVSTRTHIETRPAMPTNHARHHLASHSPLTDACANPLSEPQPTFSAMLHLSHWLPLRCKFAVATGRGDEPD